MNLPSCVWGTSCEPYLWFDAAVDVVAAQVVDEQVHDLIAVRQQVRLNVARNITQHADRGQTHLAGVASGEPGGAFHNLGKSAIFPLSTPKHTQKQAINMI